MWTDNARVGWPERSRGLHYWLGWEYAALLSVIRLEPGSTVVDIGTGAYSIWPYMLAAHLDVRVLATDLDPSLAEQRGRRDRVGEAGLVHHQAVQLLRCDARRLPFPDGSVDAVTAVSTVEHVRDAEGDRVALQEMGRVLRPGGRAWITVPYREAGSMIELDEGLRHFQWHYSPDTLRSSLIGPSGLRERRRLLYRERLPFYDLMRRLPRPALRLLRPWASLLSAMFIRPTDDAGYASAALLELELPG